MCVDGTTVLLSVTCRTGCTMHSSAPAGQKCKVARRSWSLRDVCVDGTTVILSGTFRISSYVQTPCLGPQFLQGYSGR